MMTKRLIVDKEDEKEVDYLAGEHPDLDVRLKHSYDDAFVYIITGEDKEVEEFLSAFRYPDSTAVIRDKITKSKSGYSVKSESGKNLGGPYKTKKEAVKRLGQVEYFKNAKDSRLSELQERVGSIESADDVMECEQELSLLFEADIITEKQRDEIQSKINEARERLSNTKDSFACLEPEKLGLRRKASEPLSKGFDAEDDKNYVIESAKKGKFYIENKFGSKKDARRFKTKKAAQSVAEKHGWNLDRVKPVYDSETGYISLEGLSDEQVQKVLDFIDDHNMVIDEKELDELIAMIEDMKESNRSWRA